LKAIRKTGELGLLGYEDMTPFYAQTLRLWRNNFNASSAEVQSLDLMKNLSGSGIIIFLTASGFPDAQHRVVQAVFQDQQLFNLGNHEKNIFIGIY